MSPWSRKLFPAVLLAAVALLISPVIVLAQSDSGRIGGSIKDQNGALVPGATVTVTSDRTAGERTTITNAEGGFEVCFS